MSIEYTLSMATNLSSAETLSKLKSHFNFSETSDASVFNGILWITVGAPSLLWVEVVAEGSHFKPNMSVFFRLSKDPDDRASALRAMLQATQLLLKADKGDALLLLNGEHIILQRLQDVLTLNADYESWTSGFQLISEIHLPYVLRPIPSPYL